MKRRIVLGINAAHDAAACLLIDGQLVVAIPEERLSRLKRHEGFPDRAVAYCLQYAGLDHLNAVDLVVMNEYMETDFGSAIRESGFCGELIVNPSHHLLHAYYAWIASGFDRPAVLVLDGDGYSYGEYERRRSPLLGPPPAYSEMQEAESMYVVTEQDELSLVQKRWALWDATQPYSRFPSLGHMFSVASEYIFGHMQHAGKTMGLAPYGDASCFPDPIVTFTPDGLRVDTAWITKLPPRSALPAEHDPICRNIAAKVQAELEHALLFLCNELHRLTGVTELSFSGGVALNSVANGLVRHQSPFTRFFATPAAGDSGIAIGAAIYGDRLLNANRPRWPSYNDFHGRPYADQEIQAALHRHARLLRVEQPPDLARTVARDIADGKFIGWFEGGSEFGPRALGHRSIICDPRPSNMQERLNARVKFREPFRPYAASVLAEYASEIFDITGDEPFMMTVAPIKNAYRERIPSVSHIDGTSRIQTVDVHYPGRFREVIEAFHTISGLPLILNTSFNIRGEPIIETLDDALRCFLGCNLDVLYLGEQRITKLTINSVDDPASLVPVLNDAITIGTIIETEQGAAGLTRYFCQARTGYRAPVSADDFMLLQHIDAQRSIRELATALNFESVTWVVAMVSNLQQSGFISLMASG